MINEPCQTCLGSERIPDPAAPWWKFWAWKDCPECTEPPCCCDDDGSIEIEVFDVCPYEVRAVVIPRADYERLLELEARVAKLEAVTRSETMVMGLD